MAETFFSVYRDRATRIFSVYKDRSTRILSSQNAIAVMTIIPTVVLMTFIMVLPILWAVFASFHEIPIFSPEWTWVGLSNYTEVLTNPNLWESMWRGLIFAVGSVGLQLVVGLTFALALNRSFKFSSLVRAIGLLPFLVPTAIVAYLALWMGNPQWGIINYMLVNTGLIREPISWFGNPSVTMPGLIVANSWKYSIFVTLMALARLQSIPEGLYEAATMAGASPYQKFRDITLPNLKGIIFIVVLLRGVWMFNKFDIIWILTKGGPLDVTTTSPIYAYLVSFNQTSLGKGATISMILFAILVAVALVYFHVLNPEEEVRVE